MSKTLSNILTIFKVVKIISRVVLILCIVGGVGSLIGLALLPMAKGFLTSGLFGTEGFVLKSAVLGCIIGIISCAGEAVFELLVERYCANVMKAETPFTFDGAKECFRLGIASLIISVSTSTLIGIITLVFQLLSGSAAEANVNVSFSISIGLFLLFLSLIFKHGAEIKETPVEEPCQEEPLQEEPSDPEVL